MEKQGVARFSALNRNALDPGATDGQIRGALDGLIRLEVAHVFEVDALAEEMFRERLGRVELAGDFLVIVASGVEARLRYEAVEKSVPANVIPMRVGDQDGGQRREMGCVSAQGFVGDLGEIGTSSRVDPNQLPSIV